VPDYNDAIGGSHVEKEDSVVYGLAR
jgi:hypothetical protein